jgi:hypothetical protein
MYMDMYIYSGVITNRDLAMVGKYKGLGKRIAKQ